MDQRLTMHYNLNGTTKKVIGIDLETDVCKNASEIQIVLVIWGRSVMKKFLINYQMETLVILPHLDDEFALVPIIKKITSYCRNNITFIYCAERNRSGLLQNQRREENIKALSIIDCPKSKVIYLNDHFTVDDLKLADAAKEIYIFINTFLQKTNIKQLITLNFEGGHPDHDALALIIQKIAKKYPLITPFFVPAYNYRKTIFVPVSVFRPLATQRDLFTKEAHGFFIWIDGLKIAFFYTSERWAFLKLIPFILYKAFFSRSIYVASRFDIDAVDWSKSLCLKRYSVNKRDIINKTKNLK